MSVQELAEISRFYGSNPEYVIAGGGNTSFKDEEYLYIKASGTSLAGAWPGDFVKMDRAALARIWEKNYPAGDEAREAAVLADMMAARVPGEENKRPSVETLLHDILPFAYVVHTHPALVNGITCARNGEAAARELFACLWIPSTNPGYILSSIVKNALDTYRAQKGVVPDIIFLQNHGVFAGAGTPGGVKALYDRIMNTIGAKIKRKPDLSGALDSFGNSGDTGKHILAAAAAISGQARWYIKFERNPEIARLTAGKDTFTGVSRAFSPDHIVYAGSDPLFITADVADSAAGIEAALKKHAEKTGSLPKIAAVQGLGVFGLGVSEKAAANAAALFNDEVKVSVYAESFGGPLFLSPEQTAFINNWEVERYRSKMAQ